jgi:predicted lipoprotein with Yx(FWY)xxD motif
MRHRQIPRLNPLPIRIALLVLAAALLLAPAGASASQATKRVAKQAPNATLGKTILVNLKGRTLYSLSAERKGRFICTGTCTATWRPLTVPRGVKPTGPVRLGTIKRPEGRIQVTYKGLPLYTFDGDTQTGQVNGEGIRDVGTWHAAVVSSTVTPQPQPEPQPPPYTPPSTSPAPSPYPYPH